MPNEPLDPRDLLIQQLIGTAKQQFSKPAIGKDDEGDLAFGIAIDKEHRVIRLRFAKPVSWLAFEPENARAFCNAILDRVNQLESPQPIQSHATKTR
jgi:hypothetical protein